jgi:hypothetical protein
MAREQLRIKTRVGDAPTCKLPGALASPLRVRSRFHRRFASALSSSVGIGRRYVDAQIDAIEERP